MSARETLWAAGVDETVEVNQRALIDKILARYSGEHTVFRELLQNADDARSKNIEIRFNTKAAGVTHPPATSPSGLPDLENVEVTKWTFRNDGDRFRPDDWNRLKKIAEGNPDESKIGAFGVGFYALFSVTEHPFVTSGDDWMGFYWKDGKDQLYVRRGKLPDVSPQDAVWTSFEMDLREHAPISTKPLDLAKFCATSITFMNYIRQISVFVDQHRLFTISKASGLTESVQWPMRLQNESPLKYMKMASVSLQAVVIVAYVTRWVYAFGSDSTVAQEKLIAKHRPVQSFFASLNPFSSLLGSSSLNTQEADTRSPLQKLTDEEKLQVIERSVQLHIYTGNIAVKLPPKIASEIERATRKKSPADITYQIVYTDKTSYDSSIKEDASLDFTDVSVFQGVRADLDGTGSAKLFIGHATAQSTGVGGHHASRFIPTVEREALDLVDSMVVIFNKELLAMGGLLSRVIYETEMDALSQIWGRRTPNGDNSERELENKFAHLLRFFAFRQSTPSPAVSYIMKTAFLGASGGNGIRLLSNIGVKLSTEVRRYDEALCGFLRTTPFLKPGVSSLAESLLTSTTPVRGVDMKDILNELQSRPLELEEMIKCLKWRLSLDDSVVRQNAQSLNADFLATATVFIPAGATKTERVISLGQIRTYYSPSSGVIRDSPLPPHTLPIGLGEALPSPKLAAAFSWKPLSPSVWLEFLVVSGVDSIADQFQISREASFAQRVLVTIAEEAWGPKMSSEERARAKLVLANVPCIPTNLGLRTPSASYFPNVSIFADLAIVSLADAEKKGPLKRMLVELGVRDHVDLQLIFTRHIASGQWSIPRLISYFVGIRDILTKDEMEKLMRTSMFFAAPGSATPPNNGTAPKRYLPGQLHEPSSENIALGLPVLDWTDATWDPKSPEAQFVFDLGLLKHPSVDSLVKTAASNDIPKRDAALHYLLSHFDQRYRQNYSFSTEGRIAFVPAVLPDGSQKLLPPAEVFAQPDCAILGFPVVRGDVRRESKKLQIPDHPQASQLVQKLIASPPHTLETQRMVFEYLSGQINDFEPQHFEALRNAPFILVKGGEKNVFLKPSECYIGSGEGTIHSKLFTFVDPRSASAQSFLAACGVCPEPSPQQIVDILLRNPPSFFALTGSESAYLEELRQIATNIRQNRIDRRTQNIMKSAPIFLASKIATIASNSLSEDEEDEVRTPTESRLLKPAEVIIVDDLVKYRLFKESIWAAPPEDFLEEFYRLFGSAPISTLIEETINASGDGNAATASQIRELVLERLPLFLHDRGAGKPTAFKFTWFRTPGNFIVKAVKTLSIRNTLKVGRQKITKSRSASAGATRTGNGPVTLYVAYGKPDLVEVAHAVCQVMFKQPTGNDSLLFSTILSTELRALKRIGYDVDRIIAQQKENAESQRRPDGVMTFDREESKNPFPPSIGNPSTSSELAPKTLKSSIDSFKNKILPFGNKPTAVGSYISNTVRPSPDSSRTMTPTRDIERNMQIALSACRKERTNRIDSRSQMSIVKETQNSGYCDESANANIRFIQQVAGYRIWVADGADAIISFIWAWFYLTMVWNTGVTSPDAIIGAKLAVIERFANILTLLRDQVFKIGDSVSMFYDLDGPLIAFNRNGSIFVNLRVYEQWHDESVVKGQQVQAISFYYFVLGHEIAHNLVDVHNAEHEFYFSTLCEKHLSQLSPFLVDR